MHSDCSLTVLSAYNRNSRLAVAVCDAHACSLYCVPCVYSDSPGGPLTLVGVGGHGGREEGFSVWAQSACWSHILAILWDPE